LVLLPEPGSKTAKVAEVKSSRPGRDLLVGKEGEKRRHHIIGGTNQGL
jgi:hypothetical protein